MNQKPIEIIRLFLFAFLFCMFIACDKQSAEDAVESGTVTVLDENDEVVHVAETDEEIEELVRIYEADYHSDCVDKVDYKLEVMTDEIEISIETYSDDDCTILTDYEVLEFTIDDFYGDYTVQEHGDNYIVNGIEFYTL